MPHPDNWGTPADLNPPSCGGAEPEPDPEPAGCPDGNGLYCGNNGNISGDDGVLYDCQEGDLTPVAECVDACNVAAPGENDYCSGQCPSGNGAYCGGTLGFASDILYDCQDGTATVLEECSDGCFIAEPGTPDRCD